MTGFHTSGLPALRIDTAQLRDQSNALRIIALDFASGDTVVERLRSAVGTKDEGSTTLGNRIYDFSQQWSAKRSKMREGIENLQQFTEAVAQNFDSLDHDMAEALRNPPADAHPDSSHVDTPPGNSHMRAV